MARRRKVESEGNAGGEETTRSMQRWSAGRKARVVLRLLGGETADDLSRELGVEISTIETWREQGIHGLEEGFRSRRGEAGNSAELSEALQRLGELSMENELLRRRCGLARPSPLRRSKA